MASHSRAGWCGYHKNRSVASNIAPGFFVGRFVHERGVSVGQVKAKAKGQVSAVATSQESHPVEIVQLLDVLARIEARRQAKLRALREDVK